ncbi:lycopene beta-cyclase CrtY [Qipengyuania sp. CAU 1752]
MSGGKADVAIVGGGLSGGLIALALRQSRPDCQVVLLEGGEALGGNHRWSWFASDCDNEGEALLASFRKSRWDGYDVVFPSHTRRLDTRYFSLASHDFDAALRRELAPQTIRTGADAQHCTHDSVTLGSGEIVNARSVIDCRGFTPSPHVRGGWQVFMGRHMRTRIPHGIARPVIMDAGVDQAHGYRFVYVLPLGASDIFIEDTYYQDTPVLDRSALSARLDAYAGEQGWEGDIIGSETGVLPVVTGGDFSAYRRDAGLDRVATAGTGALLAHPLTSYTVPFAVRTAQLVAQNADLPGDQLAALLADHARQHWNRTGYYRLLGSMLFGAASPRERYRVFERFYRLDRGLIERFYAGRSTLGDKLRVLSGKPPVPVLRAIAAIANKQPPLVAR